jgi:hypothetical protein
MLWSDDEDHTSHWDADVEKALNSGSKYLLVSSLSSDSFG